MLERDLQSYLFGNPEVLFPGQKIQERHREFCVQGKRIDLLFLVDDVRYIVELKAVPLTREHIGQVVEYYGLMKDLIRNGTYKMVLVAPSVPDFRKVFLEEIGIRCVEIQSVPPSMPDLARLRKDATDCRKKARVEAEIASWIPEFASLSYDEMVTGVTKLSLAASHRFLRDTVEPIREIFPEYELRPVKMARAESSDLICEGSPDGRNTVPKFQRGGAWWAYSFGHSEEMPKNNVPNISAIGMPRCFDLAVNAELRPSQAIVKAKVADDPSGFDKIVREHGGVQFQALVKLEHKPRFYHWIPVITEEAGSWNARTVLESCCRLEREYDALKGAWMTCIEKQKAISNAQIVHIRSHNGNKKPNVALRFVRPFPKTDKFWSLPYSEQCARLTAECGRLKPLIDFFLR